jgi:hypothetical protein
LIIRKLKFKLIGGILMTNKRVALAILMITLGTIMVWGQSQQPHTFFRQKVNLTPSEISTIEQGQVVTKVLTSGDPKYGMLVFGAVYINAPIEKFATVCRDVKKMQGEKVYLAVQDFSPNGAPPKTSDFDRLTLEKKDVDQLGSCKNADCDLQIFDVASFQKQVDWKSNDKYAQANKVLRQRLYDGTTKYLAGGLKAFGSYRDRENPYDLYAATKQMVESSYYLSLDKTGGISRHIVDYPQGKLPGAEDFFYWEKIDFGQEPTIRVNHVTLFPKGAGVAKLILANKQLYASRYMRLALQMFYCVPDTSQPNKPGFFLIEMNDSRLPDFSSFKLSIVRKVATGKATDATRDALEIYRKWLTGK